MHYYKLILIWPREELYQGFQMELAASYDRERKYWMEVVTEQDNFKAGCYTSSKLDAQL